jgi:hypothetical protein
MGLGLLTTVALIFAIAVYVRMIRYERGAALHLPPDTELAVRVDVENVTLFEPVRKHLLPLVNELLPAPKAAGSPRLQRIKEKAGLDLALDLREIVVGRGPGVGDWIVLLGGKFPKSGAVAGLASVLGDEGQPWQRSSDGVALSAPSGVTFAQCEDGTLVLAADEARVRAALPRGITSERLGLSLNGPAAVSAKGRSLETWHAALAERSPALGRMGRLQRVTGEATMSGRIQSRLVLRLAAGTDVTGSERAFDTGLRQLALPDAGYTPVADELQALAHSQVSSPAAGILELILVWKDDDLDRGSAALAAALRRRVPSAAGAAHP